MSHTRRIRLTSAVTVLSAADPVRVFEDFATLDVLSGGRAELIVGRGAFPEPFPLFGADVGDYDGLFAEKFDLLRSLGRSERVSWTGQRRTALNDLAIAPRPVQTSIPTWIAVGGSPESAARAGALGAPMALAVLGGPIARIRPLVELYREAGRRAGWPASALKVAISSHLHVAPGAQEARDAFFPHYAAYWAEASPRGRQPSMTRAQFDRSIDPSSGLLVGSVDEIVDKLLLEHSLTGMDRLLAQIDIGALPFRKVASVIELLATEVAPRVRKAISAPAASEQSPSLAAL